VVDPRFFVVVEEAADEVEQTRTNVVHEQKRKQQRRAVLDRRGDLELRDQHDYAPLDCAVPLQQLRRAQQPKQTVQKPLKRIRLVR
jgi:hypothetical protein